MGQQKLNVRPEYSALGRRKAVSPLLAELINSILELRKAIGLSAPREAVDLGCGQLRNLRELRHTFPFVWLVDTEFQLNRTHDFGSMCGTITDYVRRYYHDGTVIVMNEKAFRASDLRPDVIFSINVMDVVPAQARRSILDSVREHLPLTGQFASLVPRNDSRTLQLCQTARVYEDGHVFPNHGAFTYYKNWAGAELQRLYRVYSLSVTRDLSRYRHSCLICMRERAPKPVHRGFDVGRAKARVRLQRSGTG
jgi:hypothetical protein